MNNQKNNILAIVTQLAIIAVFISITFFMFTQENIVLNPIPYTVGLAGVILAIDYAILTKIFKEDQESSDELSSHNII